MSFPHDHLSSDLPQESTTGGNPPLCREDWCDEPTEDHGNFTIITGLCSGHWGVLTMEEMFMCHVKCNKAGHKVMYTVRMQQCKQRGGGGREREKETH